MDNGEYQCAVDHAEAKFPHLGVFEAVINDGNDLAIEDPLGPLEADRGQ